MGKFVGDLDAFKAAVASTGRIGEWAAEANGGHRFRAQTGEVVTWWPSKGTIYCQGTSATEFDAAINSALGAPAPVAEAPKAAHIFVVHGHDREARDQLELVLRRLGLSPFILQNSDGGGATIVEALEKSIYRDAAFGIVLMTPDDFGYPKTAGEADRQPRARQNVILELGMVMAALGRERVAILQKGALERPSDTDGILRIEFNDHVREIVPKLVQRLQAAGYGISGEMIAAASA